MKQFFLACCVLLSTLSIVPDSFDAMIATERSFASQALQMGNKKAFLAFMADSAIMYSKGQLTYAKPVWQEYPESTDKLYWGPSFADISQAGDLGYTHGPWYMERQGKRVGEGSFITIWKRQADGRYKFIFDLGVEYKAAQQVIPQQVVRATVAAERTTVAAKAVLETDRQFAGRLLTYGPAKTYASLLSLDAHLFRPNQLPLARAAIQSYLTSESPLRFQAQKSEVAESGDLAYVYGSFQSETATGPKGVFIRIWKNEMGNGWRIVAELLYAAT